MTGHDASGRIARNGVPAATSRRPVPAGAAPPPEPPRAVRQPSGGAATIAPARPWPAEHSVPADAVTGPISDGPIPEGLLPADPVPDGGADRVLRVAESSLRPGVAGSAVAGPDDQVRVDPTVDAVHRDERYRRLRSRLRRFVFTATPLFLAWYGLFVGLSAFAPQVMRTPVIGSVNAGMLLGLSQFVTTLVIVTLYGRFARRELDPRVEALRDTHVRRAGPPTVVLRAPIVDDHAWRS